MVKSFADTIAQDFWVDSEYADEEYVDVRLTDELVVAVELELGYKLPRAYVQLMHTQNGGIPKRTNHRTSTPTTWAADHVSIIGIFAIGRSKRTSLCGDLGSKFWVQEWGYPDIGIYFADCPSAGHDMLCLDYTRCTSNGEPQVVHVDQEVDYRVTVVAASFEAFILGLEPDEAFESSK